MKTITFSEEDYLNYTKKDKILHVTITFSLKQLQTRAISEPKVALPLRFLISYI